MKNLALNLTDAVIAAGCPQDSFTGLRVSEADKSDWEVFFTDGATTDQRNAAGEAIDAFDLDGWKVQHAAEEPL